MALFGVSSIDIHRFEWRITHTTPWKDKKGREGTYTFSIGDGGRVTAHGEEEAEGFVNLMKHINTLPDVEVEVYELEGKKRIV